MKKISVIMVVLMLCVGCTQEDTKVSQISEDNITTENVAKGYQDSDNVESISSTADLLIDISDPKALYEDNSMVALVHIDSIDGGSNYSEVTKEYVYPYTYGKMTVVEVYKGDIEINKQVNYYRLGGIVTYQQHYDGLNEAQRSKFDSVEHKEKPEYIEQKFANDIDIEVNKDYLVYLVPETVYHGKDNGYAITGFQGGLREVKGNLKSKREVQVFNNFTKTWETLNSVLD